MWVSAVLCVWTNQWKLWTARCTRLGGSHLSADAWSTQQSERSAAGPICSTTGRAVWVPPSIYTSPTYSLSLVQPFITMPLIAHLVVFLSLYHFFFTFVSFSFLGIIKGDKPNDIDTISIHINCVSLCNNETKLQSSSFELPTMLMFSGRGIITLYNQYHGRVRTVVVSPAG